MPNRPILVVDDEPAIRMLVRAALINDGLEVIEAANGQEALEVLETTRPGLIFLDMGMPVLDGAGFAREAHALGLNPRICVVTARGSAMIAADEIGAEGCLSKPFGIEELRMIVAGLDDTDDDDPAVPRRSRIRELDGPEYEFVRRWLLEHGPIAVPPLLQELDAATLRVAHPSIDQESGFFQLGARGLHTPGTRDRILAQRIPPVIVDIVRQSGIEPVLEQIERMPHVDARGSVRQALQELAQSAANVFRRG